MTKTRITARRWGFNKAKAAAVLYQPDTTDWIDVIGEDLLNCPVPTFERHMAQRYQDWNEFQNWMNNHEHSTRQS